MKSFVIFIIGMFCQGVLWGAIAEPQIAEKSLVPKSIEAINIKLDSGNYFLYYSLDESTKYASEGLVLAKNEGDDTLTIKTLKLLGIIARLKGDFDHSLSFLFRAKEIATSIHEEIIKAQIINEIGYTYVFMYNPSKAIDCFLEAKVIFEQMNNIDGICDSYILISALFYYDLQDYENAIKYNLKHLEYNPDYLSPERNGYTILGKSYSILGQNEKAINIFKDALKKAKDRNIPMLIAIYSRNLAEMYADMGSHEYSIQLCDTAIKISKEINDYYQYSYSLTLQAHNYMQIGEYEKSEELLLKSLDIRELVGNKREIASGYLNLGTYYYKQKQYIKAIHYLEKCINLSNENEIYDKLMYANELLSQYYERSGEYEKSLDFYKNYSEAKDSVNIRKKSAELAGMEFKAKIMEKDFKIDLLNNDNENQLRITILIIIFALVLITILFFRYKSKTKTTRILLGLNKEISEKNIQLEEAVKTRDRLFSIVSHDIANPIFWQKNMIDALPVEINDLDKERLGSLLRSFIDSTSGIYFIVKNLINWSKINKANLIISKEHLPVHEAVELSIMETESIARSKNIHIRSLVDKSESLNADRNIFRIVLRNLLMNSIKYSHKEGTITIDLTKEGDRTIISVKDNGIGISEDKLNTLFCKHSDDESVSLDKDNGMGLTFCHELINKCSGKIWAESQLEEGSIFYFYL